MRVIASRPQEEDSCFAGRNASRLLPKAVYLTVSVRKKKQIFSGLEDTAPELEPSQRFR